jgi:hypothetical protein
MTIGLLDFQVEVLSLTHSHGRLPAGGWVRVVAVRCGEQDESCGTHLALETVLGKNAVLRNADSCRRVTRRRARLRAVSHGSAISGVRPAGVAVARARSGPQGIGSS